MAKIAAIILFFLLALTVVMAILGFVVAVLKVLVELAVRLILPLAGAGLLGAVVGLLAEASGPFDGMATGILVACLAYLPLAAMTWRLRSAEARFLDDTDFIVEAALAERKSTLSTSFRDPRLQQAWGAAEALVPDRANILAGARDACARLEQEEALNLDTKRIELISLITSHVPSLVEETSRACEGATASESVIFKDKLVRQMQVMGDRAAAILEEHRVSTIERLTLRTSHVAQRLESLR